MQVVVRAAFAADRDALTRLRLNEIPTSAQRNLHIAGLPFQSNKRASFCFRCAVKAVQIEADHWCKERRKKENAWFNTIETLP